FVHEPVKVTISGDMPRHVRLPLHPSNASLGFREYELGDTVYIDGSDAVRLKGGEILRLKNLIAVRAAKVTPDGIAAESVTTNADLQVVQWVPGTAYTKCRVIVPMDLLDKDGKINNDSLKTVDGYVESYAGELAEHETVQFERFGFCILDKKMPLEFIFISK
ncbi:MAG: hypothetical protein M1390_00190, partial [Candidatus Marsarchaeota archaeon]|nr:hypothetical protein [Candidatus Marsarchaeota archaeon]